MVTKARRCRRSILMLRTHGLYASKCIGHISRTLRRLAGKEAPMHITLAFLALVLFVAVPLPAIAQQEKLGRVTFQTSCDTRVQAQFERGVAMLHSYWFTEA